MNTLKIFVLDDDLSDFELLKAHIKNGPIKEKIILDWEQTEQKAITEMAKNRHDIYLIDYSLNMTNGIETISQTIKAGGEGPFILLTGTDTLNIYDALAKEKIYNFILKKELSKSLIARTIISVMKRKETEKNLKKEKNYNHHLISNMPQMIIRIDNNGRIIRFNNAVTDFLRKPTESILNCNWQKAFSINQNIDLSRNKKEFHTNSIGANGTKTILTWDNIYTDEYGYILIGKDITREMQKRDTERQKHKMEALGQLAGGVAHEINNLLLPIIFSTEQMLRNTTSYGKKYRDLKMIIECSQKAANIVSDILAFSRTEKLADYCEAPYEECLKTIDFIETLLPKSITLEKKTKKLSDKKVSIKINSIDLYRVIQNLITNSVFALNENGIIKICLTLTNNTLTFSVSDKGIGISSKEMKHIFQPFYTTKEAGKGTGMGLAIVQQIINEANGKIEASSRIGKGTSFKIQVPVFEG